MSVGLKPFKPGPGVGNSVQCQQQDDYCSGIRGLLIMERLYMEAQDGLKTIAPPLFLNIFFYFLLV